MKNIKKRHIIIPLSLALIDQMIKFYIFYGLTAYYDVCTKINGIIRFHPIFNEKVITLNARFGWKIPREVVIIVSVILIVFLYCGINWWVPYITKGKTGVKWINIFIMICCAGIVAFLCDQIFLGKTLDYLEIRGVGILDLKDIYLCVGLVGVESILLFYKGDIKDC